MYFKLADLSEIVCTKTHEMFVSCFSRSIGHACSEQLSNPLEIAMAAVAAPQDGKHALVRRIL